MLHNQNKLKTIEQATVKTILAVEDDPGVGDLLSAIISEETDYGFHLARKPSEALNALEYVTPSLLLLDFHLPNIDGLELYDLLQILIGGEPLPAIIISGETSPYLREGIKERHLFTLNKPFNVDDLLATIDQANLLHARIEEKKRHKYLSLLKQSETDN